MALSAPFIIIVFLTFSVSAGVKKYAPLYLNSSFTSLYISFKTITDCSLAQIIPLSNVFEWSTDETANLISAVEWNIAGVFPAPTPTAGLPELYADLTIPGPPVAKIKSDAFINCADNATLGSSIHAIIFSGAPAFIAAFKTIFAASIVHFFALGCGEKTRPFLVFKASNALKIAVEVGLVVGTTAAITPIGSAIFFIPYALSSSRIPQVFSCLYLL